MTIMRNMSAMLMAAMVLSSCVAAAQNGSSRPNIARSDTDVSPAEMANVIAIDQQRARDGAGPPETVIYDVEMSKLLPESKEILAKHDTVRAHAWGQKMHALMSARNAAEEKFTATLIARNNAISSRSGGFRPNNCLSPMGRNICGDSGGSGYNSNVPSQDNQWYMQQQQQRQMEQQNQ